MGMLRKGCDASGGLTRFDEFLGFLFADFHLFMFDIEAQAAVDARVLVGNPDETEEGDEIAAPVGI